MNAIMQKRPLNHAFKRFQRLPELPVIRIAESPAVQSFVEVRPLDPGESKQSPEAVQVRFTQVLAN